MQNISADNSKSIEYIVKTYGDFLYRICYIMLKNESDAEDIVQEAIIKYFEKKPLFRDDAHTRAWLITVAKNKCRDLLRYKQRHMHFDIDEIREVPIQSSESGILDILMTLPEKLRLVIILYYVEEYRIDEIAKLIKKTPSTVKMRLQKGRKLLAEKYKKEVLCDDV